MSSINLEERMRAESSTPEEDRIHCPECSSVNVIPRNTAHHCSRGPTKDYRCDSCGHYFDEGETHA